MRVSTIIKIILLILALIFMALFVSENMEPVRFYCPVIRAHKVELVYIMLGSFFLGVITAFLIAGIIGSKMKKTEAEEVDEDEELFEEE